jgi:hypothetical protein
MRLKSAVRHARKKTGFGPSGAKARLASSEYKETQCNLSFIAVVTAGIYHQTDRTHLLQAIDITTSLTLADPECGVYDAAEWVFNLRDDLTLVGT